MTDVVAGDIGSLRAGFGGRVARVTSADSFIPLGEAAHLVLLSEAAIESAARRLAELPG